MWHGWQRVRRGEVGTLGLVRIGVSDLLGVSPGGGRGVYPPSPTPTSRASNKLYFFKVNFEQPG